MSFVRVRLDNGHEATFGEDFAETNGLEVVDQPATNLRGEPLPASRKNGRRILPRTTVDEEVAKKAEATTWLTRMVAQAGSSTPAPE